MATDYITVPVNLSVEDKTRHWYYMRSKPRTEKERMSSLHKQDVGGGVVTCDVKIHNGRNNPDLTMDDASFELVECPTALSKQDFYDMQETTGFLQTSGIGEKYHAEVTSFIKKKLGCDKVVCFTSQVRNGEKIGKAGVQGYATGAPHTDTSAISGDELAIHLAKGEEYERYLYVNLWRNIADTPIKNDHLAVLDERTTAKPDDYITKDLFMDGFSVVQYNLNARHASNHKWYYFPKMNKNEAILFKQFDSDWTKSGRVCFHMSVIDPDADPEHPPRESIELRMMCYWKKAAVNSMPTKENMNMDKIKDPEKVAKGDGSMTVYSASTFDLITALLLKIPILGKLLARLFGGGSLVPRPEYSGKPEDYMERFVKAVDSFSYWPDFGCKWVEDQINQAGDLETGIASITNELVKDTLGYHGTHSFKPEEHREIADFLVSNEKYMAVAKKHWTKYTKKVL